MKKYLKYSLFAILAFAIFQVGQQLSGNFHEVIPGEYYRAGQLSDGDISKYKTKYGIKSILNLRGENLDEEWYQKEVAEAKAAGVEHLDFRMSAKRELTKEQAIELIEVMKNAPKPMLVHCRAGSDRTGLASAVYVAGIKKLDEEFAESQLSVWYGHFYLVINNVSAMDDTFERLEPYLGYPDS